MTIAEQHPDPIAEGLSHASQRLVQLVAVAVVARQIHQRLHDRHKQAEQARALEDQRRTEQVRRAVFDSARSRWAPAHDRQWLDRADLIQTARAWSAALPYAAEHPAAASAVRNCEERLRTLHPHGMDHYDRHRQAGHSPEGAMRQAAPFFARDPNVRTGQPASTPELGEGTGQEWASNDHGPLRSEWDEHRQRQRAQQLITSIRSDCHDQQLPEPTRTELRTALEIATNLPGRVITNAIEEAHPAGQQTEATTHVAKGARTPTDHPSSARPPANTIDSRSNTLSDVQRDAEVAVTARPRPPGEVAADDFPFAINESMRRAAGQPPQQTEPRQPRRRTPDQARRRNP